MAKKIFITGTGTDVGKTYVSGLIVKKLIETGYSTAYYKAAVSGNERDVMGNLIPGDARFVKDMAKSSQPLEEMCPYIYEQAVSPHLASRLEGNPVSLSVVKSQFAALCEHYDYVVMEGSGGILCPICVDEAQIMLEDIIKTLDLSCILVADAGLGTINSVGLTAYYMKQKGMQIKGLIMNHYQPQNIMHEDNLRMCEMMTGLPVLAVVADDETDLRISADVFMKIFESNHQ